MGFIGRNRDDHTPEWRRISVFVVIALLVHLAAIPPLRWLLPDAGPPPKDIKYVTLLPGGKSPQRPNRPRPAPKKEARKKEPEKPIPDDGQVVDIPPTLNDEAPEETKYLSEHNTRTERETRSRHQTNRFENALNERSVSQRSQLEETEPQEERTQEEIKSTQDAVALGGAGEASRFELPDISKEDAVKLDYDETLGRYINRNQTQALRGTGKKFQFALGPVREPGPSGRKSPASSEKAALFPSLGVLAKLNGAPANDHLPDLEEGEGTFLNSREFMFASFFNRMKRGVSQHWNPLTEYRRRDPTGNIFGTQSRVTVLQVTLNADGSLNTVDVERSSGINFLDREAVSAFRRAQPFPNPPSKLFDGQAETYSFPFAFHLEFGRNGFRLPF